MRELDYVGQMQAAVLGDELESLERVAASGKLTGDSVIINETVMMYLRARLAEIEAGKR